MASDPAEVAALDARYRSAMASAAANGTTAIADELERDATSSQAVISRDSNEVFRLAFGENQGFASFYKLVEGGLRIPNDPKWDWIRNRADEALFPYYKEEIGFAALTLDDTGVRRYGDCHMFLKESMISFRTTVFTGNSAEIVSANNYEVPPGHRATWERRGRLAVAKLASSLTTATTAADLPGILKSDGVASDDKFVEVHIFGSFTIRTLERVTLSRNRERSVRLRDLRDRLKKQKVPLKEL